MKNTEQLLPVSFKHVYFFIVSGFFLEAQIFVLLWNLKNTEREADLSQL